LHARNDDDDDDDGMAGTARPRMNYQKVLFLFLLQQYSSCADSSLRRMTVAQNLRQISRI